MIVETATYEYWDRTIDSQVVTLRRAGADVFLIVAIQELAEQAINKAFDIGWTPIRYVAGVSQSISSTMTPAGREKLKGAITAVYDKDPADARWSDDAGFRQYAAFITKYMSRDEQDDARVVNGFGVAATIVHVLRQCGNNLSRKNIMYQAANIDDLELPMLLPGVKISTSASNYHPIRKMQLASFNGSSWELFGDLFGS